MKYFCLIFSIVLLSACSKEKVAENNITEATPVSFTNYVIEKNAHYCNINSFVQMSVNEIKFSVKFDSTAIYTTTDPGNQDDINKLYGFSDNNAQHHQYSARIGWRWSNNALRLFGYCYNEGTSISKELCTIPIGTEINCSIKITAQQYIFSVNGIQDFLPRKSQTEKATGYKLYPYFGGDETAPHKISIQIKDL